MSKAIRCIVLCALCVLRVLTLQAQPTEAEKPNFVLILIDDLGWSDLGCYGSTFYETPNIDRLASQGVRFTNAYAAAPICSPSRASILTGKYPARLRLTDWIPGRKQWQWARLLVPEFNQQLPLEEVTIAEALQSAGYVSASIGKWHLGAQPYYPEHQGFALNVGGTERGSPPAYFCPFKIPTIHNCREGEYLTDHLAAAAEQFLEQNKGRPFFLYLPHFAVHTPLQAKPEVVGKYERKTNPEQVQNHPVYAAMIESMDESVGRIMRKLDELGLAEKTIIFFTSDNGGLVYEGKSTRAATSNAPLRIGKGHLYEGGIRVPLIVRWPGTVKPQSVSSALVNSIDFYPTILEMAGAPANRQSSLDGLSLMPLLTGTGTFSRGALYWHYPHYSNQGGEPSGALRLGDYKLIEFYEDGKLELYNLKNDVGERNNLAGKMPEKRAELHKKLQDWRKSVEAVMPLPNPEYDPTKADQGLTGAQRRPK